MKLGWQPPAVKIKEKLKLLLIVLMNTSMNIEQKLKFLVEKVESRLTYKD